MMANNGWCDIETAPKDGQEILVRGQDGCAVAFFYEGEWIADLRGKGNSQTVYGATYWMPLPELPEDE